jgi:ParB family chromosome partitioning protein
MILVLSRDGTPVLQPVFYGERRHRSRWRRRCRIEVVASVGSDRKVRAVQPCPSVWSTNLRCSAATSSRSTSPRIPALRSTSWSSRSPMPIPTTGGARGQRPCVAASLRVRLSGSKPRMRRQAPRLPTSGRVSTRAGELAKTLSSRFDLFRALSDEARAAWLGIVVARTLEASLNMAGERHCRSRITSAV